jgi:transcription initiation factor IIE alpha subunit
MRTLPPSTVGKGEGVERSGRGKEIRAPWLTFFLPSSLAQQSPRRRTGEAPRPSNQRPPQTLREAKRRPHARCVTPPSPPSFTLYPFSVLANAGGRCRHSRAEQKEGQQRPINRTYYYVEFRQTIDGIKFRVYTLSKLVGKSVNHGTDSKGYVCPHCSKRFAVLDAVTLERDDSGMFICDRCSSVLVDDEDSTETKAGHEKIQRMNRQIEKIERFLRELDQVQVPLNDFDTAIANSVPVPRDKNALSAAQFVPVAKGAKNAPATQDQTLEISITSSSAKTAAKLADEQKRKQQMAEKNALPVWHTESTVDPGAVTNAGIKEAAERAARERDGVGLVSKQQQEAEEVERRTEKDGGQADGIVSALPLYSAIRLLTGVGIPKPSRSTTPRSPRRRRRKQRRTKKRKTTTTMRRTKTKTRLNLRIWTSRGPGTRRTARRRAVVWLPRLLRNRSRQTERAKKTKTGRRRGRRLRSEVLTLPQLQPPERRTERTRMRRWISKTCKPRTFEPV